jgi:hypothetical protein
VAELVKWPELERQDNPLEPEMAALAPVEIRFQVKPGAGEKWEEGLAAECSVAGRPAPSPGAVMSFAEWEKDETPTLYCYALARDVRDGDPVKLRVHPRDKHDEPTSELVWEKDFRVRVEGGKYRLE